MWDVLQLGAAGSRASRRPNTPRSSVCHHLTIGLGVSSPDTQPNNWRRCATGWMCMVDVTQRNGEIGGWGECERAAFGFRSWDIQYTKDTKEVGGGGRFSLLPAVGWRNQLSGMHVRSNAATWGRQERGARSLLQFFTPCLPSRQGCRSVHGEPARVVTAKCNACIRRHAGCGPRHMSGGM